MAERKKFKDVFNLDHLLRRVNKLRSATVWAIIVGITTIFHFVFSYSNNTYINDPDTPSFSIGSTHYIEEYVHADNIKDYLDWRKPTQTPEERNCGEHFAILAHEPHGDAANELILFELLKHLQSDNESIFQNLVVIQEGQFSNTLSQHAQDIHWDAPSADKTYDMILESKHSWDEYYSPINQSTIYDGYHSIFRSVDTITNRTLSAEGAYIASNMLDYYMSLETNGALNTKEAIIDRIYRLAHQHSEPVPESIVLEAIRRFNEVRNGNEDFAKFLIEELGLRGAHAYEIFVEGFEDQYGNPLSVENHGLDDMAHYLASCLSHPSCLGSEHVSHFSIEYWPPIQPMRDSEMADNILNLMEQKPGAIPVVLGSIGTHLPLVRERLCQSRVDSVTLAPKGTHLMMAAPDRATTPPMGFFEKNIGKSIKDYTKQ